MPADTQAANYSALLHYLRAIEATGTTDADTVMAHLRSTVIEDAVVRGGELRKTDRSRTSFTLSRPSPPTR